MHTIENTIEITAPTHRIVEALTTQAGLRGWFAETAVFDGTHARFTFARPEITRTVSFRVDRCDERGVVMTCTAEENNPEWRGTKLAISVEGNRVRLVHSGYPAKDECYERCVQGWAYFMPSLKSYLETGRGTPFPA
jgi:hypothetical protein